MYDKTTRYLIKVALILLLIGVSSCSFTNFTFENDVFAGTDYNFTNAVELSGFYVRREDNSTLSELYESLPDITKLNPDDNRVEVWELKVRQDMYTPTDLTREDIIEEDNPYAGTLTLDLGKIRLSPDSRTETTIRMGSSGKWSFAAETQIFVHRFLDNFGRNSKIPKGWDHQVKAEPLLNLDIRHTKRVHLSRHLKLDNTISPKVGNIKTEAELDTTFKFGHRIPDFTEQDDDNLNFYTFFGIHNIYRWHNIYYRGGIFRSSPHTVSMENHIFGLHTGISISYSSYRCTFSYVKHTRDYAEQRRRLHEYGLLSFGINW